jgi:hypothetical protein
MLSFQSSFFQQTSFFAQSLQSRGVGEEKADQDKFAFQRLSQGIKDNLGVELPPEQSVSETESIFDVDAVIDTVMNHIANRVSQAKENGASDDELGSMLEAARSGVETGFTQARDQIDALGKMEEGLASDIDAAEEGIYQGIDGVEEELFSSKEIDEGKEAPAPIPQSIEYASTYQRTKNSFSFSLTTQEGDTVTINARSMSENYAEAMKGEGESVAFDYYALESSNRSGYSLQVEGDLSDEEMAAIEELMGQVNELADEFYNGDIGTAFDMAMELESDADQIAEFSLNLKQRQVSAYEYGSYSAPVASYAEPTLPRGIAQPLSNFAEGLSNAYDTAQRFAEPRNLLDNLFEQMDAGPKLSELLKPMFNALDA